jgi:hypothetical protein
MNKVKGHSKDASKHKKSLKEKEKECLKLKNELNQYKNLAEEQKMRIDELIKKKQPVI